MRDKVSKYIDPTDTPWGTPAQRAKFSKCRPPKDEPEGYLAWHDWAPRKSKTHKQVRCREHGWFHNWVPKRTADARPAASEDK